MSPGDGTAERVMLWQSPPATDPASLSGLGLPVTERVHVTGGWHSRASHAVAGPSRYGSRVIVRPRVASDRARQCHRGMAQQSESCCGRALPLRIPHRLPASGGQWRSVSNATGGWGSRAGHAAPEPSRCGTLLHIGPRVARD
jgi:hypothetical protein